MKNAQGLDELYASHKHIDAEARDGTRLQDALAVEWSAHGTYPMLGTRQLLGAVIATRSKFQLPFLGLPMWQASTVHEPPVANGRRVCQTGPEPAVTCRGSCESELCKSAETSGEDDVIRTDAIGISSLL